MLTYRDAEALFNRARNKDKGKPIANNTHVVKITDEAYGVKLHDTVVVVIYNDNTYTLYSGGWRTPTTKARINEFSSARIWQESHIWYLDGEVFFEGIRVGPTGRVLNPRPEEEDSQKKQLDGIKAYAKKYVEALAAGEIPPPDGGDCWFCLFGMPGDPEHLRNHIEENYFVPTLLFKALEVGGYGDYYKARAYHLMSETLTTTDRGADLPQFRKAIFKYMKGEIGV